MSTTIVQNETREHQRGETGRPGVRRRRRHGTLKARTALQARRWQASRCRDAAAEYEAGLLQDTGAPSWRGGTQRARKLRANRVHGCCLLQDEAVAGAFSEPAKMLAYMRQRAAERCQRRRG